jgi:hypothetical protein
MAALVIVRYKILGNVPKPKDVVVAMPSARPQQNAPHPQ